MKVYLAVVFFVCLIFCVTFTSVLISEGMNYDGQKNVILMLLIFTCLIGSAICMGFLLMCEQKNPEP